MRPVYIHQIETLVPRHTYSQDFMLKTMLPWIQGKENRRVMAKACRESGVETRHSVLGDLGGWRREGIFFMGDDGNLQEAATRERNDLYAMESRRMSVHVARRTLVKCAGITPRDITHVIVVSSTGFLNPGTDYFLVRELRLRQATARYVLGFMGCYGSISALRLAHDLCVADASAVIMVVCIELCTLHLHFGDGGKSLLANALFSDGAAAAIVSAKEPGRGRSALRMEGFASAVVPEGEKEMTWRIGNEGFDIGLSTRSSQIIAANILAIIVPFLARNNLETSDIRHWAVHPGGKALLDKMEKQFDMRPEQIRASRDVLRRYGNMNSASEFFVLKELLRQSEAPRRKDVNVCAMAFGPGLTVESALLAGG